MATDIADWKITASDNSNVDGAATTDIAENNLPRTLNNAQRAILSGVAARHRVVRFFDDFLAGAIDARISSTAGSGTNNEAATVVADSLNGTITMKSASDDGTRAANSTILTLDQLNFRADNGGMMMETRLKVDDASAVAIFIGFTDTISTTVEMPIYLASGDALDSDAQNACGVIYDTDADTDQWAHGGVKVATDTDPTFSGSAPSNDTYYTVRVEVSAAGAVTGYIDDTAIGSATAAAVDETDILTPCIVVCNRSAAQRIVTIDYILAQQSRT